MESRTKKAARNVAYGTVTSLLTMISSFIVRSIFIRTLGGEYIGLNSLFVNILGIISFGELGLGVAVTASLYKPLAEKDYATVNAYLNFYRKFMATVGTSIIVFSIIIGPFLSMFIHGTSQFSNVELWFYFVLFSLTSAVSYFVTYKRVVLTADQSDYINAQNNFLFTILIAITQVTILLVLKSYLLYLVIQFSLNLISNIVISRKINQRYGGIFSGPVIALTKDNKLALKKSILGMVSAKIGGIVLTSTDSLIVSMFVGLVPLGKYANYLMITNGLTSITNQVVNAVTPSIGNHRVNSDENKSLQLFTTAQMLTYAIVGVFSIGMASFVESFIRIWVGSRYELSMILVFFIVLGFYINQVRTVMTAYVTAYELFWHLRYKSIFEALLNFASSIILAAVFKLGILSVVLGTLLANIIVNLGWEYKIVSQHGLPISAKGYFFRYITFLSSTAVILGSALGMSHFINSIYTAPVSFVIAFIVFTVSVSVWFLLIFVINPRQTKDVVNVIVRKFRR